MINAEIEVQTDPIESKDRPVQTPFDSDTYDRAGARLKEENPKLLTPGDYVTDGKSKVVEAGGRWPLSRDCGVSCQLDEGTKDAMLQAAANQAGVAQAVSPFKDVELSPTEQAEVALFLKQVLKPMEEALQDAGVSQAFLGLEMSWTDQSDAEAVVRHSLEAPAEAGAQRRKRPHPHEAPHRHRQLSAG